MNCLPGCPPEAGKAELASLDFARLSKSLLEIVRINLCCRDGGMVDAIDSKSIEETHESSSLSRGTNSQGKVGHAKSCIERYESSLPAVASLTRLSMTGTVGQGR